MNDSSILNDIERQHTKLIDELGEFVTQESGTYDREDVEALGRLLRARLERLEFDVEAKVQQEFGSHLVARRPSRNGKHMLLVGHFDTVWPHGTIKARPFRVDGGRAHGPGSYDMKAGIVIMFAALDALRSARSPAFTDTGLTIVLNSDEEVFSPTSGPLIRAEAARADTACILEPSGPNHGYIFVRKAGGRYFMRIRGRASHAGRHPERGIDANQELAHKILRLSQLTDLPSGVTVNVGFVRGGERANVISPEAYAEIDVRAFSKADIERIEAAMRGIAAEAVVTGTATQFSGDLLFQPVPRRPMNERLFGLVQEQAKLVGFEACEFVSGGGSDASNTSAFTPTMDGMGATGDGAHMDIEYVDVDSLVQRAQVFALFMNAWVDRIESIRS